MLTHLQGPPSLEWQPQGAHQELQGIHQKCTRGRKEGLGCEDQAKQQHAAPLNPCALQTGWVPQIVCLSQSQGTA